MIADPENVSGELISENVLNIDSSNFRALLFLQDKLLESVWKLSTPVKGS